MRKAYLKKGIVLTFIILFISMNIQQFALSADSVSVTSINLSKATDTIKVGGTDTLKASILPVNATNKTVTWKSSDESIATVSAAGKITAVSAGITTITAITVDGELTATCSVTTYVPVSKVTLNKVTDTLAPGGTDTLTATLTPANPTNSNLTWKSSAPNVAAVTTNGVITAVAPGNASITVNTADGNKVATCKVTVTSPVTSVTLNKTTTIIKLGGSDALKPTLLPKTATNKKIKWTSSDTAIATVNDAGKISAISVGTTTITAITVDGEFTAACSATVFNPVSKVNLNKTTSSLELGDIETLTAAITPDTATNMNVIWTSGKDSIVTVSTNGAITAVSAGTTTITVTTADGGKKATCKVTVTVPVTSVSLNKSTDTLKVKASDTLIASIQPTTATNKKVTWTSSDSSRVTVSATGKILSIAEGTATITVTTNDGGFTATCSVIGVATSTGTPTPTPTSTPTEPGSASISDLVATAGDNRITLAFTAPNGATAVTLLQSTDGTTWSPSTEMLSASSNSATVSALTNGTKYYFKLSIIGGTYSGDSNVVNSTPVSSNRYNITDLVAKRIDWGVVDFDFSPMTGAVYVDLMYNGGIATSGQWVRVVEAGTLTSSSKHIRATNLYDMLLPYKIVARDINSQILGESNVVSVLAEPPE